MSSPETESTEPLSLDSQSAEFINLSAYKFVALDQLADRRAELLGKAEQLELKGTVLLSQEGINLFVAGRRASIDQWVSFLEQRPEYRGLPLKESRSDHQPFSRMLVRVKKEIITFGVEGIEPQHRTSPKLSAQQLKTWLDEGKPLTLLDVRNDYEVDLGTFRGATRIGVDHFRQFPEAVERLPETMKGEPVVMFCTGGIRCEKAGPFMEREGYGEVYQLDGGILRYFEECGGDHYEGECFVFDKRVAVDAELQETGTAQCYACQHPLTAADQASQHYQVGQSCPHCYRTPSERMQQRIEVRQAALDALSHPLPGSQPYHNRRPLNVPGRFDHFTLIDFLTTYHPHVAQGRWQKEIDAGRIVYQDQPVEATRPLRAGMRLDHLVPETIEPDVAAGIRLLHEDDDLLVVDKPAPLPMHPCGRYNRNSLIYLVDQAYPGEKIRMAHRLDANTSGCVILCRKKTICHQLHQQFEAGRVEKIYLARVMGHPAWEEWTETARISTEPGPAGVRLIDPHGQRAETRFSQPQLLPDGTALLECRPLTGRTNQIRLHLWHLGFPIQGDPVFLPGRELGTRQTLDLGAPPLCLHAEQIRFNHPRDGESLRIRSPQPGWASIEGA